MNKRGFTLIELIAVILILSAIFFVSFPSILNMNKESVEKQYKDMVKDLCMAGETYINSNAVEFPNLSVANSNISITINDLMLSGYVDKNLVNAKTKRTVKNDELIFTVLSDFSLKCEYNEKRG